ncbi:MAG: PIG-L family deacetylase [Pseudomonadota bacterium]
MPTSDQSRITDDRARPRLMELWWALRPLTSVVRFMQTGAHPDDETSGMLAALAFRDGINISYACSTRGEGGQNDIGTEGGLDLGALRTKEMERACDVLGMRLYWHSTHPEDTITDFGFSKSGEETLGRWGRDRTMLRFVEIIRTEKPDIICPTFLDVPGQHGHHRAMTAAAHAVMAAAADVAQPTNLPPWQIKKMYLPAWSGAGQAYDDDLPPPPATLTVPGTDRDPMSGWAWDRIGQQSRAYHRTQGMGRWIPAGYAGQDWPLHLAETHCTGPDDVLWSGLPHGVADLADLPGVGPIAETLRSASAAIDRAVAAFPDVGAVASAAAQALGSLTEARAECPAEAAHEVVHRLDDKIDQLGHVLRLSLGVEARARVSTPFLEPERAADVDVECDRGAANSVDLSWDLPSGWHVDQNQVIVEASAAAHDPYPDAYDPRRPKAPCLALTLRLAPATTTVRIAIETPPVLLPAKRAVVAPSAILLNRTRPSRAFDLSLSDVAPADAQTALDLPGGWTAERTESGFRVTTPEGVAARTYQIGVLVDGEAAETVRQIAYDHVAPTARAHPATINVGIMDVAVPPGKVGYIGAGNDRVGHWLGAMGADVSALTDADLASDTALAAFDAIVIGIFAMRFRARLIDAIPALHRWTGAGGTLVTLYHRPWDNWDPDVVPPKRLEIGQPSLRWRVTDETANVTQIADHPILSAPNAIGCEDWSGWFKERGLYFAKSWDEAYIPLLSMADPGEEALTGALLVADIGEGRHIHTSLILHHQMENLVPGAFRLMANFIAKRA